MESCEDDSVIFDNDLSSVMVTELAQLEERPAFNRVVVGSSPIFGGMMCFCLLSGQDRAGTGDGPFHCVTRSRCEEPPCESESDWEAWKGCLVLPGILCGRWRW